MYLRILGAVLIFAGSGAMGGAMAVQYMRAYRNLKQLMLALDAMTCEVKYRLSPLNIMSREAARCTEGAVRKLFHSLSQELEKQVEPDAYQCMCSAIHENPQLPVQLIPLLKHLGKGFGQYDLEGQLRMMEAVREECRLAITTLEDDKQYRLRSYQTISLCAGAALAILLF